MKKLLFASSLLLTGTAMAAGPSGFYLGGDLGFASKSMEIEGNDKTFGSPTSGVTESLHEKNGGNSLTAAFFGGYRFDMEDFFLAVEADIRFTDIASKTHRNIVTSGISVVNEAEYKIKNSIGLYALAGLPIGMNTEVYGRFGFVDTNFEVKESGVGFNPTAMGSDSKKDRMGTAFGLGLQHHLEEQLTLRFDYRYVDYGKFDFNDADDIFMNEVKSATTQQFTVGIQYNF